MTAPPAREQAGPPAPPDRRPPRRGGGSSPSPCTCASAAGRAAGLARPLAAAALLALSGALALPATAQAAPTLVSNIGQGTGETSSTTATIAQRFTIGPSATASTYTLLGVDVVSGGTDAFTVQVCGVDSSGDPTSTCTDLVHTGTFAAGTMSFTAPANATLSKGTTYTVVLDRFGFFNYGRTTEDGEDAGKATGWSIRDELDFRRSGETAWNEHATQSVLIAIKGTVEGVPTVTGTAVTSSPAANGNYETGEVIQVTVTFSNAVTVDTASGTPRLALTIGSNTRYADYSASDSNSTALVFAYPVVAEDEDNDGISIDADALELNGGAIHKEGDASTDALLGHGALSTQSGHRVNRADALIISNGVSVISTPRAATDTYGAGEVIEIEVVFSAAVNATTGTDFVLSVGGAKRAPLLRGNGTDTLVFGYTVQAADSDGNGIWIGPQDRTLVGNRNGTPQNGAITSVATGRAAGLTHAQLGTLSGHKVDGSLTPTVSTDATLSGGTVTAGSTTLVTFASGTATYTASVANGVEEVTFAPTKHAEATVRYLKGTDVLTDADGTDDGFQVALAVGANAITVEVTAEDGTTTQDYTVTVTRAAGASAPVWSTTMLVASTASRTFGYDAIDGSLADVDFEYGSRTYTVVGLYLNASRVTLTVDAIGLPQTDTLTLELGGQVFPFSARTGGAQRQWFWTTPPALDDPGTEFPVGATVTACLRTATQTCPTGRIDLPMVSTDATLSGGTVTAGSTTLVTFASGTATYMASVANSVEEVTFAPTKHAEATVRYLKGTDVLTDADGTDDGFQVALAVGANAITVEVTAEDGTTTQDYTVTVTRAAGASTAPVWSTTLTVGERASSYGYTGGEGTLDDDDFEYGSVTYTVTRLRVSTGDVLFQVNKTGLPAGDTLTLELGGHEFPFSARNNTVAAPVVWYWSVPDELDNPATEFPVGTTATACLRTASQTCPAGRIVLPAALPTLSIDDVSATEGDPLTFTVTLSAESDETVTVVYATADDTGISPSDYTDASDTLTFAAGVTTQTITVATTEDTTVESSETITVLLSNATNATISDDTGTGTIEDDDTAMTPTCTLNTGDLWCGVVTVGDVTNTHGDIVRHGFQGTTGGLSDETFSLMFETGTTNEYTITAIAVGATGEQLYFVTSALTDTEEESLALHVHGESDPFVWSDSTELVPGSYRWPARTGLDWSSETTVTLRLREFPRPTVTNVAVTSTPVLETDTYGAGETIEVSVTFSEAVTATSDTDFVLSVAGATRAPLLSGSGTATLVFGYTVAPGDADDNGIWIGDEDRTLVGNRNGDAQAGAITSTATGAAANIEHAELGTQSGHKVDGTRSIRTVEVTSIPLLETDTYGAGETIEFTVTFNVAVDVTGDPEFAFSLDSGEDRAPYVSSGGGTALVFGYTVASGDEDDNGIFLLDGSDFNNRVGPVTLDSDDEIEFKDTSTDVPLYWSGRGTQSGHKVDGSRTAGNVAPNFTSSAAFDAAENQARVGIVQATDSDTDDDVTGYAITGGADETLFRISGPTGLMRFDAVPDYEDPDDSDTNNTYVVEVTATSGAGTRVMTATQTIAVTVTNADEGQSGTVTIDDTTPVVGDDLTASTANAADPDGLPDPFAPTWKWYRTPDGGSETEISGAASATYTVVAADLDATLTAKASWTDTGGFANTLASAATSAVAAASTLPTLSVGNASATEGADISFPLTLSAAASANVTVTCTASFETGDTAAAADLSTTTSTATIQIGATSGSCSILSVQDTTDEDDETFTVTLSNVSTNAQLAADPTATGTIDDDDPPVLSFKQASYTAAEGGSAVEVELTLTSALPDILVVTMTAEHGAGATAEDYTGISDGTSAIFTAGRTRSVFEVTASDDAFDEADETVTFGFTIPSSADVTEGSVSEATLTLTDNDDPPTVTVGDAEATEGGKVEFEVTLSAVSGRDVTVDYATSVGTGQTATSGDFTAATGTLTILASDATDTGTVEVQTTGDSIEEENETFTLTISSPTNATLGTKTTATGTIEDDDTAPTLPTVSIADASGAEDAGVEFTATLTAGVSAKVTATWTASIESGDTAVAADLATTKTGDVEFEADAETTTFTVPVTDDSTDEDDETFTVTLSGVSSNAQLASDPTAKGTIVDDDTAPTVTGVSVTSTPVLATDTYGAGETIEVSVTFSEAVTATSDTDFELNVNGDESAPLLRGSGTATLVFGYTVAPGDEDDNGIWIGDQDRTLVGDRRLSTQAGTITSTATGVAADLTHGVLGTQSGHKVDGTRSIRTVEVTSTPLLETDTYGAGETIQFTVTFNVPVDVTGDPVFRFALNNSGATANNVDAGLESGTGSKALVFAYTVVSGDADNNGIFLYDGTELDDPDGPVRLDSDDEIEFKDTSTDVPLAWPSGRGTQTGHKVDGSRTTGNNPPSFTSSPAFDAAENQTDAGTVLAADSDADDSVTGYAIAGGADMALFEIGATSGELTFKTAPNFEDPDDSDTNNTYVVGVTATSGTGTRVMTADQTITVTVTNADEGQSGTVTIDDTTPIVGDELTASTANAADPDGLPDPFAPTWKWYRTPDGGSETEIAGETSATYTVVAADLGATLAAKATWTDTGGFANTLASAATSAVAAASALPTLSVGNASATEGSLIRFPLTLSATPGEIVSVTCTASFESGDTAAAADLSTTSSTATIQIGSTSGSCAISSAQDTIDEDDETLTVTLSNPSSNAQLATDPTAKGTIVDDDTAPTVTGVAVTSTPVLETDTYGAGETIEVSVTFDEAVTATSDTDFVLSVAGAKRAPLVSGSGTATLVFGYTVAPGDADDNGIWIGDQDRTLVGNRNGEPQAGAITSTATGTAADLTHSELGTDSAHKVDGSRTTDNVAPSFTSSPTFDAAENQTAVGTVAATDSDADDSVTGYAITGGTDMALFEIGATSGELTFKSAPNFEVPGDSGTDNVHEVTVRATSGAGTRVMTADQTIAVTVTNVDEGQSGTVTVDDTTPMVGDELTASTADAADPDGLPDPFAPTWKWYRTPDGGSETEISGAASATYTVVAGDLGATLAAKASWTDDGGFANTLSSAPTSAVAALPTLSIADESNTEGNLMVFELTLSEIASASVTVTCTASFESGDTAVAGDLDFTSANGTVQSGQDTGLCAFPSVQDTLDEEDETFTVTLSNVSSNAQLATDPTAKGTINDDDDPPTVTVADATATEGDKMEFEVTLSAVSGRDVTVDYATSVGTGQTATSGADFTAANGTLTIPAADATDTGTIEVQTTDDNTEEDDETFTLTISNPTNATLGTKTAATGTIEDDDGTTTTPTCTLNTGDLWCSVITVGEVDGHYGYNRFHNEGELSSDSFMVGTSRYTVDILSVAGPGKENAGDPTLDLGERPGAAEQEALDRLVLHLGDDAFRLIDRKAGPPGTFYWEDNDLDWSGEDYVTARLREIPPTEVTLHLSDDLVLENATPITVTATASPASPVAFTVEISADPVAPATGDDFTLSTNRTLSFAANATDSTGTVTIQLVDNDEPEPSKVVTVSGAVSNAAIENPDDVTLTIINDDREFLEVAIDAPAAVDENAGTATVTYTLTKRDSAPVADTSVIFYHQDSETATRGVDYTPPVGESSGGELVVIDKSLPPSAFSNTAGTVWVAERSFEIGIVDDQEAEPDETIVFHVASGTNRSLTQTITIRDDDRPPAVSIAAANPTVLEDQPAVFTLSRTGATGSALTVTVALTEQSGRDLLPDGAATQRTVTFARGASAAALAVELKDDELTEPDGDLTAAVQAGAGYTVGDPSTATVTVEDDDAPTPPVIEDIEVVSTPRLRWRNSREEDTYGEGENIRIEVEFDQPVHVEGYPVLALEVGDPCISVCEARYESGSGTDTLVFAYLVLDTEIDRNGVAIPANPIGASIDEFDGFSIRNDWDQEARLSYRREGTKSGHKADGTRQAAPHLSVEDAEAHEADGEMAFTVRLEPHGLGIVTVDYETRDGSGSKAAVAGEDYTETSGTLRFNPLETERTVTVPIIDDDEEDDGETFTLRLSNPQGARLRDGDRAARGTIRNSDPKALSASFPASAFASASHSGADDRPQAVVAFSEAVAEFAADTPSVSVTGATVASVRPHAEDGLENAWVFFLAPDGAGDVTFALVADAACAAGGICTAGGRTLTEAPAASTIPGPGDPEEAPLTASFEDLPEAHDGESAFTFRIAFSEPLSWMNGRRLREDVVAVAGGRATKAGRVNRRRDLWELTVEPDSLADVTVTLEAGAACGTPAAVCAKDGRALSETVAATVAGPDGAPANAPAAGAPTIRGTAQVGETLSTSTSGVSDADGLENATFAYQWIRTGTDIQGAAGPTYTAVGADEGKTLQVRVGFTDDAGHSESLTSAATGPVEAAPRANTAAQPTPKVSVADARVREAAGATLDFAVTLSAAAPGPVTVDYRTLDASAKAGEDYEARSGTLAFAAGETEKTLRVTVLDDAHDEGDERMVVVLDPGAGVARGDRLAVGIIENSDPMPRAWLARFGRTASDHVVEAIAERWRGGEAQRPRTHFTLGGRAAGNLFGGGDTNGGVLHPAGAGNPALADDSSWAQRDRLNAEAPGPAGNPLAGSGGSGHPVAGRSPAGGGGTSGGQAARFALMNALGLPTGGLRDVLMGSSFFYSRPLDEAAGQPGGLGQWSAWGRTAATRFSGADGKLSLNGEVATAILGVDSRRDRWLAGVTLSYSEGEGAYTQPGAGGGGVRSTLTSLNPYVQYRFSERTHLWAVAGYGVGGLTLTPAGSESVIDTDLEHAMAAFGGRGVFSVRSSRFGAFEFAVRSDALVTNTESAAADNLISAAGAASRVRLMLEGSGSMPLGSGGMLRPTLEAGLRYDGGDAETGAGLEIGGGLGYAAGALAVEVRARLLLAHQDTEYEEWGFSGSIRYQPQSGGRGLSVNLGSTWGQAQSGVQSLWTRPDASGLAPVAAMHAAQRFQAEFGYGFAGRRAGALWTPYAGIDRSGGRQALRLGVKLALGDNAEAGLEVGRLDSGRAGGRADGIAGPEHAVQLRGSIRW